MRIPRPLFAALGLLPTACTSTPTATGHRHESSAAPAESVGPEEGTSTALTGPASTTEEEAPPAMVTVTVPTSPPTTFVLPEQVGDEQTDEEWWADQPGYQSDDLLSCIRSHEQGPAGYATDTGNGFYGAYQFTMSTWRSVGGSGNPADASPAEQDERAWALYERDGLTPWPTPNRLCQ